MRTTRPTPVRAETLDPPGDHRRRRDEDPLRDDAERGATASSGA